MHMRLYGIFWMGKRYFSRFLKYFVKNYYFHFIFLIYYVIIKRVNAEMVIFYHEFANFCRK